MMMQFSSPDEETLFYEMFDENLQQYKYLMDKVKEELYGTGHGNYANLPGSCFSIIKEITDQLFQTTKDEYLSRNGPELKHLSDFTLGS